jgi:hypothetical protein
VTASTTTPTQPATQARPVAKKKRREPSSARDAIILVILVVLIGAYIVAFGLQTLVWGEAHHLTRYNPWVSDVPQAVDSTAPPNGSTQLRAYNYEFKVPWAGKSKTNVSLTYTQFRFDSGQVVVFFDPEAQLDTMRTIKNSSPLAYQQFANLFGGQPFETNYALFQAVYSASPAATSPFMSSRDAIRENLLLLWKIAFGYDARPGLHSIEFNGNRGFQFGDPSTGFGVALRIFDGRDNQFRFIFATAAESNAKVQQADINLAVQTLQEVPISER